jgi:hypothetical protein
MEITLPKEILKKVYLALFLVAMLAIVVIAGKWLAAHQAPKAGASAVDLSQPAITALTDFYSPDRNGERAAWEDKVCANMTGDGCLLFRKTFAGLIWQSPQSFPAVVSFGETVETLDDKTQVWKVNVEIGADSIPVYIHVEKGEAGWLLARVLFDEEAQARYGDN